MVSGLKKRIKNINRLYVGKGTYQKVFIHLTDVEAIFLCPSFELVFINWFDSGEGVKVFMRNYVGIFCKICGSRKVKWESYFDEKGHQRFVLVDLTTGKPHNETCSTKDK